MNKNAKFMRRAAQNIMPEDDDEEDEEDRDESLGYKTWFTKSAYVERIFLFGYVWVLYLTSGSWIFNIQGCPLLITVRSFLSPPPVILWVHIFQAGLHSPTSCGSSTFVLLV